MKTVLFVCYHNAGRSQMAEAFTNKLASDRNIPIKAMSAGTMCTREINPIVVQAMDELGISMKMQGPKLLMQWHMDRADRMITMHCKVDPKNCPRRVGDCEDWELEDPAGKSIEVVREIRDDILRRVELLFSEMEASAAAEAA
jgi:arsenate reductase (thioredoxin)